MTSKPSLIDHPAAMYQLVRARQQQGARVGVVPTMGALHAGHLSLVEASNQQCDATFVTIFVNPTQFGPQEDFGKYPRTLESDLEALSAHRVDAVFVPRNEDIYPPGYSTYIEPPRVALPLEGAHRPGHFRGVATVVLKLLQICPADIAFFGAKDYQQTLVVRRMVEDLNVPTKIDVRPTVREADGLAMSSRNRYLTPLQRQQALALSRSLDLAARLVAAGETSSARIVGRIEAEFAAAGITEIDYIAVADPETLAAVDEIVGPVIVLLAAKVGSTRLIDNRLLVP